MDDDGVVDLWATGPDSLTERYPIWQQKMRELLAGDGDGEDVVTDDEDDD